MADQQSNDTIRQMMQGFSAMQFNLGLLPMQTSQSMAGAQFQAPPPPPQIQHPSIAAMTAMQNQQAMIQQTLQAAQVTRYQPPPSAPMPSVSAMVGMGAMNPFAAPAVGGGGGGFMPGSPGAGFAGSTVPRMPSIFNPFAPTLPQSHFATPAMRNVQMMHAQQAQTMGTVAGIGEAGMGIGGSIMGGMMGSMLGPIGAIGGAFLGSKIGHGIASMVFNPVTADFARGRQISSMTSPFMVSGMNMNTMTGQGMDPHAARQTAMGIRHLQRDYDFERTGFNTQDTMRVMQMSASQGLLTGAQSPDQLVAKVKEISKTVKVLMRITGDPDVQSAIQSLGQMRELGFQGVGAQAGAVSNRAMFARMAGVSQGQAGAYGMMGADVAGQFGLGGATGYMAGMAGAGLANMAVSSGALNDLQLSRAGGRSGLAQINATGQLAAMQDERYLLSAMGRDSKGRMTVDADAYRKSQSMSFDEVTRRSADALREMGSKGIFEWNTRKQEFKDQLAQKLGPLDMNMNMFRQAQAFMNKVPGMSLGTALQSVSGGALNADQARALELQGQSHEYWDAQVQQLRVQRREVADQERAHRDMYRTPGMITRAGRGLRGAVNDISDTVSTPYRQLSEHFDRVREDEEAADRGERITRYGDSQIASNADERALLGDSLREGRLRGAYGRGGSNFVTETGTGGFTGALGRSAGRQMNRIGSSLGLTSMSDANRLSAIADYSRGRYTTIGETFGDPQDALKRVQDVIDVSQAVSSGPLSAAQHTAMYQRIGDVDALSGKKFNAADIVGRATTRMLSRMGSGAAGLVKSARAMSASDLKEDFVDAAMSGSEGTKMTRAQAEKAWEGSKAQIMKRMSDTVYASGDQKLIEQFEKAKDVDARAGGVSLASSRDAAEQQIADELKASGMGDVSDKTMSEVKAIVSQNKGEMGDLVIALATAERAKTSGSDDEKAVGEKILKEAYETHGADKVGKAMTQALPLAASMSKDTSDAFQRTFRGVAGLKGVEVNLGLARTAAGHQLELGARDAFSSKLAQQTGRKDLEGMSTDQAIASISADEMEKLDPRLRKAVESFKATGDRGLLDKEIAKAAPTGKSSRQSGGGSHALRALDEKAAELQSLSEDLVKTDPGSAEGKRAASQLDAAATDLFAGAVKQFADSVKDLKGHGDNATLNWGMPSVQSMLGNK